MCLNHQKPNKNGDFSLSFVVKTGSVGDRIISELIEKMLTERRCECESYFFLLRIESPKKPAKFLTDSVINIPFGASREMAYQIYEFVGFTIFMATFV